MGILDNAKGLLGKAQELAGEHSDQVKAGIDKAAGLADKATKGRYADQIGSLGEKAAGLVTKRTGSGSADGPGTGS